MSLHDTVADTIGAIYDAAMAPERWVEALDRVCALFDGATVASLNMEDFGPIAPHADYWVCSTIDRGMVDWYRSEYALNPDKNEIYEYYPRFPLVKPFQRTEFLSDADYVTTEQYELWHGPMNFFYLVSSKVYSAESAFALFHIARRRQSGDYGAADVARMGVLALHVRRAVQMQRRFALAEAAHASLDGVAWAILYVDAAGRILSCNATAEALLRAGDGLSLRRGRLVASAPRETGALLAAIRQAAVCADGEASPPAILALPRPSTKRALEVLVAPVRRPANRPGQPPTVALFVSDPERRAEPSPDALRRLYGLSKAEAALAAALVDGSGLGEAAERLGIGQATAKTQLQAVFAKTDTRRQAQLVNLLLKGPAALRVR